ncbi:MAG TPA: hypothetical protein VGI07_09325 [Solirubrobacteraceae bacterium]
MNPPDPVIAALAEANPIDPAAQPGPRERAEADAIRRRILSASPRSRVRATTLVPVLSAVVVVAVIAVFLGVGGTRHRPAPAAPGPSGALILQALPTGRTTAITPAAMARELHIVRERLGTVPGSPHAALAGADRIRVSLGHDVSPAERERIVALITQSAHLYFYDWEADVLTPNGRTVASQLAAQNRSAIAISQGAGAGPGSSGDGSVPIYTAVRIASRQPVAPFSPTQSRLGPQYYLFGRPESAACVTAAANGHTPATRGGYCLLAGPTDEPNGTSRARAIADLDAALPAGVTPAQAAAQGVVLDVPQGTVVIQAANPGAAQQIPYYGGAARFYVLKDNPALTGADITKPTESTDQSGAPDVRFGFTPAGAAKFQSVTAQVARRGANVSLGGETLNQHFAVVLGGLESRLITVPSIDFKQYPDGIIQSAANSGADITGGMTATSAKDLATQLRYGALPLDLRPVG